MATATDEIYYGKISISKIENCWPDTLKSHEAFEMNNSHCKVVHYPDCQQLIIWLPTYGGLYNSISLILQTNHSTVWEKRVSDVVGGSVQIILDTLPMVPEEYIINIKKNDGLIHQITFIKYAEGNFPEQKATAEPYVDLSAPPIVYRDGVGNILPNEDLILRNSLLNKLTDLVTRKLGYVSEGRSGKVVYTEGNRTISFYMEMGGGNCIFNLDIPAEKDWESKTGFSLERREDIIGFVAAQTCKDQAPSGIYTINETSIDYYHVK